MNKKLFKYAVPLFLLIVFAMAFFLRAQETLSGNFLFLIDSGRDMLDVKKIVFEKNLTLIGPYTSMGGVFQGPLYYYLLSIPTFIFQGNPWGNILLMLIISLSTILVAFCFSKKYFGIAAGVTIFTLFAFSPEAIAAATYFWNPHPMWLLLTLYIFILFSAIKNKKWAKISLWPLIALTFHFEMAFGFFLFISTFLFTVIFQRKTMINKLFFISLLLSLIFFLPQVVFDLKNNFIMSSSVIEILKGNEQGLITPNEKGDFLSIRLNNINTLKNNFTSSFIYERQFSGFTLIITVLTALTFLYSISKNLYSKDEKLFLKSVSLLIFIISLLCIAYPFPLRYWFLTGFQSFYLVIFGLVLSKLFKFNLGKLLLILIFCYMSFYFITRINTLYINPPNDGGVAKIKGKIDAIDYIYNDAGNEKFGLLVFTPPVLTDAYDYLVWWHGAKKYGYIPHNEKRGAVYLLIEPDGAQPWSYKGWLETVIVNGEIQSTTELPSGFIIQKRIFPK